MTPRDLEPLRSALALNNALLTEQIRVQRAMLPQFYSLPDLCQRWGLSPAATTQLLRDQSAYQPHPGRAIRVHLDAVLRIDAFLEANR